MPPWLQSVLKKLTRVLVRGATAFLDSRRRIAVERRVRGWEQCRKLRRADAVVVSYGKSGRTWLRVMLSRFYQVRHGLPERMLIGFDNLHRRRREIPRIFFTHDNYLKDYTGHRDSKVDYRGRPVVLLVRHPGDVAVSQYFQWRFRMKRSKKALNEYPGHGEDVDLVDFLMRPGAGLPKIVEFMNAWAREVPANPRLLVVRYEDLRAAPEATLARILERIGTPGSTEEIAEAVRFASFENMRRLEERRTFWLSGGRMKPRDHANPDSFKVRRGKVGGFRDYLDDEQVAALDAYLEKHLSPVFRYTGEAGATGAPEEVAS
jgi:hypothetical protein